MGFCAEADGCSNGLTGEHVRTVKLASNDVVEELLPIGLSDDLHLQAFFFEIAFFFGDDNGRAVGELDEAEFEFIFFDIELFSMNYSGGCNTGGC